MTILMNVLMHTLRVLLLTLCEAIILARWHWRLLLAVLAFALGAILLGGCLRIPVEVHPPFTPATATEPAKPIPLPTVPPPSTITDANGEPIARVIPDKVPDSTPASGINWSSTLTIVGWIAGLGGGAWAMWTTRLVSLARRAVALTAAHAETVERIDPADTEALRIAKLRSADVQRRAGVAHLIDRWRDRDGESAAATFGASLHRTRKT